ncbi:NAD(P)H-hydrate dehydratase [Salinarimonas chemoclinalis]|uniref:NAD(P)H-hydrate dehydratase n=1 Tax=Salinarimonas chemoclinalis TaxID=3241599 RepID=UPI003556A8FD
MMHHLLDTAGMREADRRTIAAGRPGIALMEAAGAAVADAAAGFVAAGARVLVACGPGNNGGDGFVAARVLAERGFAVTVALLGERARLAGDAATAASRWTGPNVALAGADPGAFDLVIDALLGAGLDRDVDGAAAAFLDRLAGAGVPVLAVDVPSGLDGDTGRVRGTACPATLTVGFARRKPGHLLMPGRALCGRLVVADIGIPDAVIAGLAPRTFADEEALWRAAFPRPALDAHKYARGHALVLSGPADTTGAARLVARGALRIGAGAVTVGSPRDALAVNAAHLTAIMLRPCDDAGDLAGLLEDARLNVLALGPGLGRERARALVEAAAGAAHAADRALVLDADVLTAFAGEHDALAALCARTGAAVATPHAGEFAELFSRCQETRDAPSKLAAARAGAAALGIVLVDKGPDTVIAAPDGRAAINAGGTPHLATAGSGDVLAGFVAGLLAQGMPAFEAACAAVWLHGRAGARVGPGLIAEDLPEMLPALLGEVLG